MPPEDGVNKLQAQHQAILRAKRQWEGTIDAMSDSIAIIDKDHKIVRLNKAMLDKIGASSYDEVLGTKCHACVHSLESPPDFCPHDKLLLDEKEHRVEIFNKKFGGHCEITVIPFRGICDDELGSIHIIRDINQRKKDEKEKEMLLARNLQSQKLQSVGQLASGIAHEINSPGQFVGSNIAFIDESFQTVIQLISTIIGHVNSHDSEEKEFILKTIEEADWEYLAEEIPAATRQSREGIERITSIVRAIKEFSHPGTKSKSPIDINHVIQTTVTVSRNEWKYVAKLETDLDQDLPHVPCLAEEIGQVILNLIVNSAHAIAEKIGENPSDGKGTITISTTRARGGVELRISDTGVGIPKQVQPRIFEPFYTTKEVGKGIGQGLAISHDVITQKHGGKLDFTTRIGVGTEFIIWLPLK